MLTAGFGLLGWILVKLRCNPVPLLLGFILSPFTEENLRRALLLSRGSASIFVTRPISLVILISAAALLAVSFAPIVLAARSRAVEPS